MHGQKKRRKRDLDGAIQVEGHDLVWSLVSEPQWTTDGAKGLSVCVSLAAGAHRDLVIEYPFDASTFVPQRPKLTAAIVGADIARAIAGGWDPLSRGRLHRYQSLTPLAAGKRPAANTGIQRAALSRGG